jgi:hypothetical protein
MFERGTEPIPEGWTPSDALVGRLDEDYLAVCRAQRRMLARVADADRAEAWRDSGARDMAHWLSMRHDISWWKASRWIGAAHALNELPRLAQALASGELGLDKVVELARFAQPATVSGLISWACGVSVGTVRHRGDVWVRAQREDVVNSERCRRVSWSWDRDSRRFGLLADLPVDQGVIVAQAIEGLARQIPTMPGEEGAGYLECRRADALVALCSGAASGDGEPSRAAVVVHAQLDGLEANTGGCEIQDGPAVDPDTARRLLCNATVQTIVEDHAGRVIGVGRASREPSAWMIRQIRYRDRECRFPACGSRRFTEAHHLKWWRHGGSTDLDNLLLICSFHHRLVHEHGWSVAVARDGTMRWFRPDGAPHRSGPSPPAALDRIAQLLAVASG